MITREEYGWLNIHRSEGFRWIARDKNSWLYVYDMKPKKRECEWKTTKSNYYIEEGYRLFPCVTWEDEAPTKIDDLIRDYESHQIIVGESEKVAIPSFVADWIEENKGVYTLQRLFANSSKPSGLKDWLYCNNENCEKMALAWINGYVVEKEKQYILKFSNGQYLYNCDLGMADESLGCKLTQAEIEAVDPRLMQFAVEVE